MAENPKKGYFISGYGSGGSHGPRARELTEKGIANTPKGSCPMHGASSLIVDLVYGSPVRGKFEPPYPVWPLEGAFELLRYDDPETHNFIYVTRYNHNRVNSIIWGEDKNALEISASPQLHAVFDEYLPKWLREHKLYIRRDHRAWRKGLERAGLTKDDAPKHPADNAIEEEKKRFWKAYYKFYDIVVAHVIPPKPLLVEVPGLEGVLDKIDITPHTNRIRH